MSQTYEAATSIDVDVPAEQLWRALVEPELIARYMHGTAVDTDWAVGSPIRWRGEWQGRPYEDKGEVLACTPPRRLTVSHWSPLTGEPDEPANYHHVTYELEPLGGDRTRLTLVHGNSPTQEAADAMIVNGWEPMIRTIKQVAEDAAGS